MMPTATSKVSTSAVYKWSSRQKDLQIESAAICQFVRFPARLCFADRHVAKCHCSDPPAARPPHRRPPISTRSAEATKRPPSLPVARGCTQPSPIGGSENTWDFSGLQSREWTSADCRMERVTGIEPVYSAWKAAVLPLYYTRSRFALERLGAVSARRGAAQDARHMLQESGRGKLSDRCRRSAGVDGSCPGRWCSSRLAIGDLRIGLGCNIQPMEFTDVR